MPNAPARAKWWMPRYNPIGFFAMFAMGALAAGLQVSWARRRHWAFDLAGVAGMAAAVYVVLGHIYSRVDSSGFGWLEIPYGFPWFQLSIALVLATLPASVVVGRLLDNPVTRYIATISFGIYVWHYLVMELVRRDGAPLHRALGTASVRIVSNPLLWGILLGVAVNLSKIELIEPVQAFVAMMAAAVTPAALFGLGGALNEYRLADNWGQALSMALLKLVLQPLIAWTLMVPILNVDHEFARYGVLLAAMPSGINAYVFATYYNRGVNVATNTVLISTVLSVLTVSAWLFILGL